MQSKATKPVFSIENHHVHLPEAFCEFTPRQIIAATLSGNLWLFTQPFWKRFIDKLAAAEPSEERMAFLRMIATAFEVEIVAGKAQLPEAITTQLAQGGDVFLDGKPVGILERKPGE